MTPRPQDSPTHPPDRSGRTAPASRGGLWAAGLVGLVLVGAAWFMFGPSLLGGPDGGPRVGQRFELAPESGLSAAAREVQRNFRAAMRERPARPPATTRAVRPAR